MDALDRQRSYRNNNRLMRQSELEQRGRSSFPGFCKTKSKHVAEAAVALKSAESAESGEQVREAIEQRQGVAECAPLANSAKL